MLGVNIRFLLVVMFVAVLVWCASGHALHERVKISYCFVSANDLLDAAAPRFDQYAVRIPQSTSAARLDLHSNPVARMYRTVLRREVNKGANFAGHYRVAIWGCGSSCAQFAVVNLNTGQVITARGIDNVSGLHLSNDADHFLSDADFHGGSFRFRQDSRLLVLLGAINEDDSQEGATYLVLRNEKLMLVHRTAAARSLCQEEEEQIAVPPR